MAGGRPKVGVKQVLVGLDDATLAALDALLEGRSRSDVLREAAAEWIERRSGGVVQRISVSRGRRSAVPDAERSALSAVLSRVPLKGDV